jgi:hypothetical protein
MNPKLKPPGFTRSKLKYDEPLSNFAFKFSLRRYTTLLFSVPADGDTVGRCRLNR